MFVYTLNWYCTVNLNIYLELEIIYIADFIEKISFFFFFYRWRFTSICITVVLIYKLCDQFVVVWRLGKMCDHC